MGTNVDNTLIDKR